LTQKRKRKAALAQWADPEKRTNILEGLLQPEVQARKSDGVKAAWARGDFDDRVPVGNPSELELRMLSALEMTGLECISQYSPDDCRFVYDIYLPGHDAFIEVDGTYWHNLPGMKKRDDDKDVWAIEHDFDIIRVPEDVIDELDVGIVAQQIVDVLGELTNDKDRS